ncbi:hypothetical protein Tco_0531440 [Tanacetum coccineum]
MPSYEAKHRLEIHFHVEKRLGFLQGINRKELGGRISYESYSKLIHVAIVPSLSLFSQVFASPWLPLMANSFAVLGMVIAEPGVGATTRSAAHMGSSSMGLRFGGHRDLEKSCTSRNRIACCKVAPVKSRTLVYPDSDEEDEEYCRLPPFLPSFQTPQPCTKFNSISYNVKNEVDINSMTFSINHHTPDPRLDKKDSSFDEILDDLFRIGAENMRRTEHEFRNRCDYKIVENTDHEDGGQEDGELSDLPSFFVTNVFASVCEQVDENIDISIAGEKEEVPMEDIEMDEDHDVDHLNTKKVLQ